MSEGLARLADRLRRDGGLLAAATAPPDAVPPGSPFAEIAAAGPRAAADPDAYAELVEAIREGYLLHYGEPRIVRPDDPDLALLAGDQLYALGLARLAGLGDVPAVEELADVISLSAQAQAERDHELADAVWEAGVSAIGWGGTPEHRAAKRLARSGDPAAAGHLRAAARQAVANVAPEA